MDKAGIIKGRRIFIRPLRKTDLPFLMEWWNDGRVMVHVGFPDGLGLSADDMIAYWEKAGKDPSRIPMIICLDDGIPIGETCFHDYRPKGKLPGESTDEGVYPLKEEEDQDGETEIGLKICRPDLWGQGLGTEALRLMTDYAFKYLGVARVLLNPSKTNARIIHVNEKCGYRTIGEKQNGLLMELTREGWESMNLQKRKPS